MSGTNCQETFRLARHGFGLHLEVAPDISSELSAQSMLILYAYQVTGLEGSGTALEEPHWIVLLGEAWLQGMLNVWVHICRNTRKHRFQPSELTCQNIALEFKVLEYE